MTTELINPHKFELAKNKIRDLANQVPKDVSLYKFLTQGTLFKCNNHNITGNEVNEKLVSPLQSTLIEQNKNILLLCNVVEDVYNELDKLDKENIAGIISAVKSAEIASEQAKTASSKAEHASEQALDASRRALDAVKKSDINQSDIKKTIEALKATVQILKEFKEKVSRDLSLISSLNSQITTLERKISNIEQYENKTKADISSFDIKDIYKAHQQYEKRIKIAYYVGGGAIGLSVLNVVLQLIGIL